MRSPGRRPSSGTGIASIVLAVGVTLAVAIVAAVVVVAVRISSDRAAGRDADLRADLEAMAAAQRAHRETHSAYATTYEQLDSAGYRSVGVNSSEIAYATATGFCMQATNGSSTMHVTEALPPQPGACPEEPGNAPA